MFYLYVIVLLPPLCMEFTQYSYMAEIDKYLIINY